MDELLADFLTETYERLDTVDAELVRFEREPNNAEILANIFRLVHTIKGTCGFLDLPRLAALSHAAENLIGQFRDGLPVTQQAVSLTLATLDRLKDILDALERSHREPEGDDDDLIADLDAMAEPVMPGLAAAPAAPHGWRDPSAPPSDADVPASGPREFRLSNQSLRVSVDTLEHLMTMVSELVQTRNQLMDLARRQTDSEFKVPLQRLSHVTAELQQGVMKTRMQPIANAWQKLPRLLRDVAASLGKQIELEMHGAQTELDRQVLEMIRDPLTHMVRNAADHGIESPAERRAAGKPERATIRLSARHEGGHIIVEMSDDGRGLDLDRIRERVIDSALATETDLEKMSAVQLQRFIFAAGMSTAQSVTQFSGRGVGMDVVRKNIEQLGGTIDVRSVAGEGTTFTFKIPLTLAIVPALIVEADRERFAIPQVAVMELLRVRPGIEHSVERIKDTPVLRLRNKLLPLVFLRKFLDLGSPDEQECESGFVVVTQVGADQFGIVVDRVFHTEEIVVKPMASKLRHITAFTGNTILGDGTVIMILDPNGIAAAFGATHTNAASLEEKPENDQAAPLQEKTALLLFLAGSDAPRAVPLSLVTRLEEIDVSQIESNGGRHLLQYRGHLMPLVFPGDCVKLRTSGAQPLLVFSDGQRSMALIVDRIVDIVDDELDIDIADERPGILGTAVVKGRATDILDIEHYLPMASAGWLRSPMAQHSKRRELLLVDDSAFFRNMLAPVLRTAGYDVTTAAGGVEAFDLIRSGRAFDMIISDLQMPGMDGMALAQALRAEARTARTPMIALSATANPAMAERLRGAGFHDFVAKFDRQGLLTAIRNQDRTISDEAA